MNEIKVNLPQQKRIWLDRYTYYAQFKDDLDFRVFDKVEHRRAYTGILRQNITELMLNVWGRKVTPDIALRYPRDWWEAVKERWAPQWFRKRYPVIYVEHVVSLKALYPFMNFCKDEYSEEWRPQLVADVSLTNTPGPEVQTYSYKEEHNEFSNPDYIIRYGCDSCRTRYGEVTGQYRTRNPTQS